MNEPFWGDVAFSTRVTLDLGTSYLMLWSFFPLYIMLIDSCLIRAVKIKETGLWFMHASYVARLQPFSQTYELFTNSQTPEK